MKLPLPLQSYPVKSIRQNSQRLINLFPVPDVAGGKTQVALYPTPALLEFTDLSGTVVRGSKEINGVGYVIVDSSFGTLSTEGVFTVKGSFDTATGKVSIAAIYDQVLIATGASAYLYTISTGAFDTITDEHFPVNCIWVTAQDEYFIALVPQTDRFQISVLSNGSSWDPLDFASAEVRSDNLVSCISLFEDLWFFGENTTETWFNVGAAFPFEPQQGSFLNYGCAAAHSVVIANNSCIWLSKSSTGQNQILMANGQVPNVVSDEAIHYQLSTYDTVSDAFAYAYQQEGHEFYVITFPTANTTFAYDITTDKWAERNSINTAINVIQPAYTRHRANCYMFLNGKHLVGDFVSGKVFEYSLTTYYDDETRVIQRQFVTPTIHNNGKLLSINAVELFIEPGIGIVSGQGSTPLIALEVSKDGGFTWGNVRTAEMGAIGDYGARVRFTRLGQARNFCLRFTVTDPVLFIVLGGQMEVDAEGGYDTLSTGTQPGNIQGQLQNG